MNSVIVNQNPKICRYCRLRVLSVFWKKYVSLNPHILFKKNGANKNGNHSTKKNCRLQRIKTFLLEKF